MKNVIVIIIFILSLSRIGSAIEADTLRVTIYDTVRVVVYDTLKVDLSTALRRNEAKVVEVIKTNNQDSISRQMQKTLRYLNWWVKMLPRKVTTQFAGNMGAVSLGIGWKYGKKDQLESDLLIGVVPKHDSDRVKVTMTVKQQVIPFHFEPGEKVHFAPITIGGYMNMIFGDEFWTNQPDRYPHGYYWFSTRFRFNLCVGQRVEFNILEDNSVNIHRNVAFFYELSVNDLYMIEVFKNPRYLRPKDYVTLSMGFSMQLF